MVPCLIQLEEILMDNLKEAVSFLLNREEHTGGDPAEQLCRSFLKSLDPDGKPENRAVLEQFSRDKAWGRSAELFLQGVDIIFKEIEQAKAQDPGLLQRMQELGTRIRSHRVSGGQEARKIREAFWAVFCPQAAAVRGEWEQDIEALRVKRSIKILSLSPSPVKAPAREILFTSNALLTLPPEGTAPSGLALDAGLGRKIMKIMGEEQTNWYDHPVQIGTPPEKNEILYGLRGLSNTLLFEKNRGRAAPQDRLEVALSVSVTHPGLKGLARDYIKGEISKTQDIKGIDLYVFTETDTRRMVEEVLGPAAGCFGIDTGGTEGLSRVFGVDGAYGRHYNFLKAIAPLWQLAKEPGIKATFKIDLDQVFPQEELLRETGGSAFDLLCSPLWGAKGQDQEERPVTLGMIAGALVNEADIHRGLFTPDVTLPEGPFPGDQWIFASRIPQALSTEAEMMCRYRARPLDGHSHCLSRIHVTGGTNGIRVESLRRHQPFTPSFIGRAEDQAYLMSVLFEQGAPALRYAQVPGLIMRHDKHAFAGDAIQAAAAGKAVGDYERMLFFSHYARALPWPLEQTRDMLDPFTGSFVLSLPATTAMLCLALKVLSSDKSLQAGAGFSREELLRTGASRIGPLFKRLEQDPGWIRQAFEEEKRAWKTFYAIIEELELQQQKGSREADQLVQKLASIIENTRIPI